MESLVVECLRCGTTRKAHRDLHKRFDVPECPECGYLGWAPVLELSEPEQRAPAEQPVPKRRHLLRLRRSAA
jgi:hypothetical protein